jgi:hypothetical protein
MKTSFHCRQGGPTSHGLVPANLPNMAKFPARINFKILARHGSAFEG